MERLVDFNDPATRLNNWRTIDDTVMGGVSYSLFELAPEGWGVFRGLMTTESNGGFCSIRSPQGQWDISAYDGIELRVRDEGHRYGVNLRDINAMGAVYWQSQFETVAGEWTTVRIPFETFVPLIIGQRVQPPQPLDLANIRSFGMIIAGGDQEGPFQIEIDWVGVYADGAEDDPEG